MRCAFERTCAVSAPVAFEESSCVTLEALEAMSEEQRMACLLPVDALLAASMLTCHIGQRKCGTIFEWNAQARRLG